MVTKFTCGNCKWEGTSEEMKYDLLDFLCPTCENPFTTDGHMINDWEIHVDEDPEDEDYGDFPDQNSPY